MSKNPLFNHFTILEDNKKKVKCNYCEETISMGHEEPRY